ncbi:unnamed protein product, partial [Chrysoparadoxa australica]
MEDGGDTSIQVPKALLESLLSSLRSTGGAPSSSPELDHLAALVHAKTVEPGPDSERLGLDLDDLQAPVFGGSTSLSPPGSRKTNDCSTNDYSLSTPNSASRISLSAIDSFLAQSRPPEGRHGTHFFPNCPDEAEEIGYADEESRRCRSLSAGCRLARILSPVAAAASSPSSQPGIPGGVSKKSSYLHLLSTMKSLGSNTLEKFGQSIMKHTSKTVGCTKAVLWLIERESEGSHMLVELSSVDRRSAWESPHHTRAYPGGDRRLPLTMDSLAGIVACKGKILNYFDPTGKVEGAQMGAPDGSPERTLPPVYSILSVPVWTADGDVAGVVQAVNKLGEQEGQYIGFNDEDENSIEQIAELAGNALHTYQLSIETLEANRRLEGLIMMLSSVAALRSVGAVMQKLFDISRDLLGASRVTLFRMDPGRRTLTISHAVDQSVIGVKVPVGKGIAGKVACDGRPLNVHDAYSHPKFNQEVDQKTGFRTQSLLCVPVTDHDGNVLAVVQAVNKVGAPYFNEEDTSLLRTVAELAGITLHKADLLNKNLQASRRLGMHSQVLQSMAADCDMMSFMANITQAGQELLGCMHLNIWLVDSARQEVWAPILSEKRQEDEAYGNRIVAHVMSQGHLGHVASSGRVLRYPHADQCPFFVPGYCTGGEVISNQSLLCMAVCSDHDGATAAVVRDSSTSSDEADSYPAGTAKEVDAEEAVEFTRIPESAVYVGGPRIVAVLEALGKIDPDTGEQIPFDEEDELEVRGLRDELVVPLRQLAMEIASFKGQADEVADEHPRKRSGTEVLSVLSRRGHVGAASSLPLASLYRKVSDNKWARRAKVGMSMRVRSRGSKSWDLDVLALSQPEMVERAVECFRRNHLLGPIKLETLRRFLVAVAAGYRDNPYHNFHHAFSVFHATALMLHSRAVACDHVVRLGSLVAALCHDIDHPGHNNQFAINTCSQQALVFSDDSVLERHHAYKTFLLLKQENVNVLQHLEGDTQHKTIRELIVKAILATDMACHADVCKALGSADIVPTNPLDSLGNSGYSIVDAIVHAADISAQTLVPKLARKWGELVNEEFTQQAAMEMRLGLPVAPHMLGLDDPIRKAESQCDFIGYVLRPLWTQMAR